MTKEQKALLEKLFGVREISRLTQEIFFILNEEFNSHISIRMADKIYKHISDNVMRQADLMNYEFYPPNEESEISHRKLRYAKLLDEMKQWPEQHRIDAERRGMTFEQYCQWFDENFNPEPVQI
jgi:hypothetical protein